MEMEPNEKKSKYSKFVIPALIAVVTLIAIAGGATYAYYTIGVTNNWTQARNVNASTATIGTVSVTNSGNDLSMVLNQEQELVNTTYYAQAGVGQPAVTTLTNVSIGTVQSSVGNFNCNMGFSANYSDNTLAAALVSTGELVLSVNGTAYDLKTNNTNFTFNVNNFQVNTTAKPINAQLKYVIGTGSNQTGEGGKNVNLNLSLSSISCVATD